MTTTPESVEQLADAIAIHDVRGKNWDLNGIKVCHRINAFLRSHGIDPATMKPIEKPTPPPTDEHRERVRKHETAWLIEIPGTHPLWYMGQTKEGPYKGKHAWTYTATNATRYSSKKEAELACADLRLGELFGDVIVTEHGFDSETPSPPPPQPERHRVTCGNCGTTTWSNEGHSPCNPKEWSAWPKPEVVVGQRDRELADKLFDIEWDIEGTRDDYRNKVTPVIADHLTTERAEAEAAKRHAKIVVQEVAYERDKLRTQLAATEAKLREAEGRVVEIEASGERGEVFVDDENRQHLRDAANGHVPAIECDRCDLPFFVASTTESIRRIKCCPRCGCKQLTVTETVYLREDNPQPTNAE